MRKLNHAYPEALCQLLGQLLFVARIAHRLAQSHFRTVDQLESDFASALSEWPQVHLSD